MPAAPDDFHVVNATIGGNEAFAVALDYINNSMPLNGVPVMEALIEAGITILINDFGDNSFNYDSNVLAWDPSQGLLIRDEFGEIVAVNSAALTLLHEAVHALDPDLIENLNSDNAMWGSDAERFATQTVNEAAAEAGESQRVDHGGNLISVSNPTTHTNDLGDLDFDGYSDGYWSQLGPEAIVELGPSFQGYELTIAPAPDFGTPSLPRCQSSALWRHPSSA